MLLITFLVFFFWFLEKVFALKVLFVFFFVFSLWFCQFD